MITKKLLINVLRWIARILGILLGLGIFLFGIISRIFNPSFWIENFGQTHLEVYLNLLPPILLLASFIIAWLREAIGGVMIIGFWVLILALPGQWGAEPFWGFIVGLFHLFCWWQSRKLTSQAPNKNVSK